MIQEQINTYFKDYKSKAVGIISDKQHIFEIEKDRLFNHDEKVCELTGEMFPHLSSRLDEANCIYYFCDGSTILFYLPDYITFNQYSFLSLALKDIVRYNKTYKHPIEINVVCSNNKVNFDENMNINEIKDQLSIIKKNYLFPKREEVLIGEELDNKTILSNILSMSGLDSILNSEDLANSFRFLLSLYKDNYYKKYINQLFPNFSIFSDIGYYDWSEIHQEIDEDLEKATKYQDYYPILLKGVKFSLEKSIQYYKYKYSIYESFNDKKYQKEMMHCSEVIDKYERLYHSINDKDDDKENLPIGKRR